MALRTTLVAAATTTTAAASAAVLWTVVPQNATAPAGGAAAPPSSAASASAPVVPGRTFVCMGPDRILRATLPEGKCPPDHQALSLEPDKDDSVCDLCDPFEDPPPRDRSADAALDALEQRVRALENAAYFEVVNKDGRPIFRVAPGGVRVFNNSGTAVAAIGASDAGGYFTGRSATSPVAVSIGASGTTAGVRVVEDGLVALDLATRDGRSSLRLPSGGGLIAGIGESSAGSGAVLVGTMAGHVKASLTVPNGRGMVTVNKDEKVGGLSLTEASIGGGMLDIGDTRGNSAVKMGHNGHRYGIVMAGPILGLPLVPKSGLPGSYFLGCAGEAPPACVPAVP